MIASTIKELTPTAVANAMDLPISTVFRWMRQDRIPGRGAAHQWRKEKFDEAVAKLKRARTSKQKKAVA